MLVARAGHRVGVIDTDIQSPGIHVIFQLAESRVERALNDYLWGKCAIEEAAYDVTESSIGNVGPDDDRPRIFLIPSSINVGEIGRILKEGYDVRKLTTDSSAVTDLRLDCCSLIRAGVNEETLLSIAISDKLLLVMRPDSQDFQGTAVTAELAPGKVPNCSWSSIITPGMDSVQLPASRRHFRRSRRALAYELELCDLQAAEFSSIGFRSSDVARAGGSRNICDKAI